MVFEMAALVKNRTILWCKQYESDELCGLKKEFLDRYDVDAVLKENHLTAEQIVEDGHLSS
ncbi:MAG: hypothetical protein ACLTLY_07615 [Agathobacter rectalis]